MRDYCNKRKTNKQKIWNPVITKQEFLINTDWIIYDKRFTQIIAQPFIRPQAANEFIYYILEVLLYILFL